MARKERSAEEKDRIGRWLARRRVPKGIAWLNQHARLGWHRNLFNVYEGGFSRFRAHDSYDNECVLALAFEHDARLANRTTGYVTYASVASHHGLIHMACVQLAFSAHGIVKSHHLDEAWRRALLALPTITYRHETTIDRSFRTPPEPGSFWDRWLKLGFGLAGR